MHHFFCKNVAKSCAINEGLANLQKIRRTVEFPVVPCAERCAVARACLRADNDSDAETVCRNELQK